MGYDHQTQQFLLYGKIIFKKKQSYLYINKRQKLIAYYVLKTINDQQTTILATKAYHQTKKEFDKKINQIKQIIINDPTKKKYYEYLFVRVIGKKKNQITYLSLTSFSKVLLYLMTGFVYSKEIKKKTQKSPHVISMAPKGTKMLQIWDKHNTIYPKKLIPHEELENV